MQTVFQTDTTTTPRGNVTECKHNAILRPHHVEHLRGSGLEDPIIAERGYSTAQFKTNLAPLGFSKWQCSHTPALLIPIFDIHGNLRLHQMRPDITPEIDGKPMKYMAPKGCTLCLDVPRRCLSILADVSIPLTFTEGSKKVDALMQKGIYCIGVLGVMGWMREGKPIPDLDHINFEGRKIFLCFDNDVSTKQSVRDALERLKDELERRGAQVWIIYLPEPLTPEGDLIKVGVDDYLLDHTAEELLALAEPQLRPAPKMADCEPTDALRKLRKETFTKQLRGLADVSAHGGLKFSKEITPDGIERAARVVRNFYGKIDDAKKWDMIDILMAAQPFILYGDTQQWKAKQFGKFAPQVGNWVSDVGQNFARNLDGRRRSHLPIWLHKYVKGLLPDQQDVVFDTFEAAAGGYMTQNAVLAMIEAHFPTEPKTDEKHTRKEGTLRTELDWDAVAQHIDSVSDIGKGIALHILNAINKRGARFVAEYMARCPDEPEELDESPWDGRDVCDSLTEADMSEGHVPRGLDFQLDFDAENSSDLETSIFKTASKNEIENSRQTSRTVFTTVKTDAPPNAKKPTVESLSNEPWRRDENDIYDYTNLPTRHFVGQPLADSSYRLTPMENGGQVGGIQGTSPKAQSETTLQEAEGHIENPEEVFSPYMEKKDKQFSHIEADNFHIMPSHWKDAGYTEGQYDFTQRMADALGVHLNELSYEKAQMLRKLPSLESQRQAWVRYAEIGYFCTTPASVKSG